MSQLNSSAFIDEEEGVDIRKWLYRLLDNWWLFLVFLPIVLLVTYFYNRYTEKKYALSTTILIKEQSDPLDKLMVRSVYRDPYELENEIGIVNSSAIKKQTLKNLDFFTEYYREQQFREQELYHNSPFVVGFDSSHAQLVNLAFELVYLSDSSFILLTKSEGAERYYYKQWEYDGIVPIDYSDTLYLGDTVQSLHFKFWINQDIRGITPGYKEYVYRFSFCSLPYLVGKYGNVAVDILKGSSIMKLSLESGNPEKASIYLNALVGNYLLKGIERENKVAQRTIDFIDMQITTLGDSLQVSEQRLEDFRSLNRIVNIDFQAREAYTQQTTLEQQNAELVTTQRYLEYLKTNLKNNTIVLEELITPTTLGINDAVLNNLVMELVGMYNERTELTLNTRRGNPYISSLDKKIEAHKVKLGETVNNLLDATNISLEEVRGRREKLAAKLAKLPKDQQELLRFERGFQLNDELYTYLLTRRSEMQIKKASNIPTNEVLDIANPREAILVSPNTKMGYMVALLIGFLFPFSIVYIKALLNNRVQSDDDIKAITHLPILGTIHKNTEVNLPVVVKSPTSVIAESFRMLRANLQFVLGEASSPVLIVTSAMKGEGKSFTAINLAAVQSSYGKKVCLVDLDLRRPRLSEYLRLEKQKGMSNYLIGKAKLKDIVLQLEEQQFDLIPSGPIPPNPSELVASKRLEDLIKDLRKEYDFIILDTPPIGMVSDAMFISKMSAFLMLVVRHNVTYKQVLAGLIEELTRNQIKGVNILYNDVPAGKKGYYRYGSRYSYYYEEEKKSFWSRFRN